MSVEFRTEPLTGKLAGEIETLGAAHGAEFSYHREVKGPVSIDWHYFFQMWSQGFVSYFTARDDGRLIGYVINYSGRDRFYSRITQVSDATFYLAPEYRGSRLGINFILAAEKEREASKGDILRWVNKAKADYGILWERMGYVHEENHYTRVNPKRGT